MIRDIEIRGGAGEFEAALIAVVLDRITEEETAASRAPRGHHAPSPPGCWPIAPRSRTCPGTSFALTERVCS